MFIHIREKLSRISRELKERFPERIVTIIAFGSRVRGDYKEWSDIDLLVVIKNKDPQIEKEIIDLIVKEEMKSGISLSPVLKDVNAFEKEKRFKTPFYESIEKEGVML